MDGNRRYEVKAPKKVRKQLSKLPESIQDRFWYLERNLAETGPMQPNWPNFSKLGRDTYHCHLGYSWVACWMHDKDTITIEVYYVGSRQNAPY